MLFESAPFAGGRIEKSVSGYDVNYYVTDHLGSVRAVLDGDGMVQGRNDYYPFGESISSAGVRYKFNGKELQTTGGVDLLDYGARMYDSKIGRWLTQDPLAEKYYSMSSYNYCLNNPLKYIDPDGKREWPVNESFKGVKRVVTQGVVYGSGNRHGAVDINHKSGKYSPSIGGADIYATHDGVVTQIYENKGSAGYGVEITYDGVVQTKYMHMEGMPQVELDQKVREGDVIGKVGTTGKLADGRPSSTGNHLHYAILVFNRETKKYEVINPVKTVDSKTNKPKIILFPFDNEDDAKVELLDPQEWIDGDN